MGGGYFAVYQPKDGVEVFTGIVAVSAAIMQTPWQQPPLNMPVSYFMLRDPNDDPMRGEKELMDPGWFMREMSQYDGPGPRLPGAPVQAPRNWRRSSSAPWRYATRFAAEVRRRGRSHERG